MDQHPGPLTPPDRNLQSTTLILASPISTIGMAGSKFSFCRRPKSPVRRIWCPARPPTCLSGLTANGVRTQTCTA